MWAQGWNKKSIAGCLKVSRRQVGRIINAFEQDGFAGLEDERTRPVNHIVNITTRLKPGKARKTRLTLHEKVTAWVKLPDDAPSITVVIYFQDQQGDWM